ncbi:MAG: 50S ribosomal protein L6 [Spirochaetales bacterium]|nr:MAG: 50S ribosomal protein L6 [Spirochaetales bacterium]
MSRIGKLPVEIPSGTKVEVKGSTITVQGPKGTLSQTVRPEVVVIIEQNQALLTRKNESKYAKSLHGLYRNLLQNMVTGVSKGFSKTLIINGVGYRAELQGNSLVMNLGYSTPVEFFIPEGLTALCETNNKVTVSGIDKQRVGQMCAEIRSLRPPEPYKGKGIRYETETIRRKVGKTGVK